MSLFAGTEGQFLKIAEAQELTGAYRQRKIKIGINEEEVIRSEFFGIDNVRQLLDQPGVVGLRVLHAKRREDIDGNPQEAGRLTPRVILVGVDKDGNELVAESVGGLKDMPDDGGFTGFLGKGPLCPPQCAGGGGGGTGQ